MITTDIRKNLHSFIADTDNSKVKGMYLLLKDEIDKIADYKLSPRHVEIMQEEKEAHLQGLSKSYTQEEARQFVRNNTKKA